MVKLSGEAVKGRLQSPGGYKENRNIVSSTLAFFSCCNLHLGTEKKAVRFRVQSWCRFHLIIETQRIRALRINCISVSQSWSKVPTVPLPFQYTHMSSQSYWIKFPFHSLAFKALLTILCQSFPSLVLLSTFTKLTVGILTANNYILSLAEM